jgi:predicted metal-binding protein
MQKKSQIGPIRISRRDSLKFSGLALGGLALGIGDPRTAVARTADPPAKIGIIICNRERTCIGGKCLMAVQERAGVFRKYPKDKPLEVAGYITCGGCPGERLERAPAEMKRYGAQEIVLASCFLAGYPPCPYIENFVQYIESYVGLPVVVGSHPMPTNYIVAHEKAGDWKKANLQKYLEKLVDDKAASDRYDSTRADFLKK